MSEEGAEPGQRRCAPTDTARLERASHAQHRTERRRTRAKTNLKKTDRARGADAAQTAGAERRRIFCFCFEFAEISK